MLNRDICIRCHQPIKVGWITDKMVKCPKVEREDVFGWKSNDWIDRRGPPPTSCPYKFEQSVALSLKED